MLRSGLLAPLGAALSSRSTPIHPHPSWRLFSFSPSFFLEITITLQHLPASAHRNNTSGLTGGMLQTIIHVGPPEVLRPPLSRANLTDKRSLLSGGSPQEDAAPGCGWRCPAGGPSGPSLLWLLAQAWRRGSISSRDRSSRPAGPGPRHPRGSGSNPAQ